MIMRRSFEDIMMLTLFVFGVGWMVSLCLRSAGMPVQDEIAHFIISRQAWQDPSLVLDLWGRPVTTIIYMLPALNSWLAARLLSIVLSSLSVLLTILAAKKLQIRRLYLIPLFLFFQPWFNGLGFATLTEVPFCLALIAGSYFWISENYLLASLSLGLLPMIRHEGIALLGIWCLWLIIKKKWAAFALTILPYFIYFGVYYAVLGKLSFEIFTTLKPTDAYGSGSWFHFVIPTLIGTGILPVISSLFAIPGVIRLREKGLFYSLYAGYFLVHTIIYRYGLFASGGYTLFLMPLAPGFALAGASGIEAILNWFRNFFIRYQRQRSIVIINAILLLVVAGWTFRAGLSSAPYSLTEEEQALVSSSQYLHSLGVPPENIYATHSYFRYLYDLPYSNWIRNPDLAMIPNGSFIVWDPHYSDSWGVRYVQLTNPGSGWVMEKSFQNNMAIVFEKVEIPR